MSERQEFLTVIAVLIVGVIIARTTGMLGPMTGANLHHAPDTDIDPSRHRHDGTQPIGERDGNKFVGQDEHVAELRDHFYTQSTLFGQTVYTDVPAGGETIISDINGSWARDHHCGLTTGMNGHPVLKCSYKDGS